MIKINLTTTPDGMIILPRDPNANKEAVTKEYVDVATGNDVSYLQDQIDQKVSKGGDSMTGLLNLSSDPINPMNAATKQYVDAAAESSAVEVSKNGTSVVPLANNLNFGIGFNVTDQGGNMASISVNELDFTTLVTLTGTQEITGQKTFTSNVVLSGTPSSGTHAVNKSFLDSTVASASGSLAASIATKISKSGDTMTGFLFLAADPTLSGHATTKQYVDAVGNGKVSLSGNQTISGNKTFANDVVVQGNLTVQGTTTTLDTEQLLVEDNVITLNSTVTGTPTLNSGFEIERGTSTNAILIWDETNDIFKCGVSGSESDVITKARLMAFDFNIAPLNNFGWNIGDKSHNISSIYANYLACSGGSISLYVEDSTNQINFGTGNIQRFSILNDGHFVPAGDASRNIGNSSNGLNALYTGQIIKNTASNAPLYITNLNNNHIHLATSGTTRWTVNNAGNLYPFTDAQADIGASSNHVKRAFVKAIRWDSGDFELRYASDSSAILTVQSGGDVIPGTNAQQDLGSSSAHMDRLFARSLRSQGADLEVATDSTSRVRVKTDSTYRWNFETNGNFAPETSGTYDIGSTSLPVNALYSNQVLGNSIDVGTTAGAGDLFLTASGTRRWNVDFAGNLKPVTSGLNLGAATSAGEVSTSYINSIIKSSATVGDLVVDNQNSARVIDFRIGGTTQASISSNKLVVRGSTTSVLNPSTIMGLASNSVNDTTGIMFATASSGALAGLSATVVSGGASGSSAGSLDLWVQDASSTQRVYRGSLNTSSFYTSGVEKWHLDNGGNLRFNGNTYSVYANTASGSDNRTITLNAGGGTSGNIGRAAYLELNGNNATSAGVVKLIQGNTSAGVGVLIQASSSNSEINIATNSIVRMGFQADGVIYTKSHTGTAGSSLKHFTSDVTTSGTTTQNVATFTPAGNSVTYFTIRVSARLNDTAVNKSYWATIEGAVRRNNSGAAVLVGTRLKAEGSEGSPGYTVDVDTNANDLRVRVTGAAGESVNWACNVEHQSAL